MPGPIMPGMTTDDIRALFEVQYQASRAQPDVPLLVRRERLLRMRKLIDERGPELAAAVQADRLAAAQALADRYQCTVLLKGSGSIIAAPGQLPHINPTGNALLATGGTGDVLAGLVGARLAAGPAASAAAAFDAAIQACWQHGAVADDWRAPQALTASRLAQSLHP